ncbi:hypothetical protein DICPUDRAFT_158323 [Dictyostelium purpureum]|uniref:Uncharacterized protein n=1 Tax=Dictyostelium purpureum TaxID=5786 RepID=F1A1B7_DICPU|nr:uncharacterized protein DICPUDRAFT_158323 [Dictyostelium purpureum]EGC30017.1 hypothetical protein DICPUDRAFT_158323 [Dictyostelium purpureum]|eukprot:XP_003293463.1 hypothetical protein DICPUDRAFT_158323 [Dictyostelium purpureum]
MSFLENLNLETILNRIEDLLNNDSDFKANYSKVRKRKSEKEERLFITRLNQILSQLAEYKDGRSMVHIFHLRFIHTNVHSKKTRVPKLIAIITEYLRLINKSYISEGHYTHTPSGTSSHSSPNPSSSSYSHSNTASYSSPNFSLTSSNPNVYINSIVVDNDSSENLEHQIDNNNNNNNVHNSNSNNSGNLSLSTNSSPLSKLEGMTSSPINNSQEDLEITTINFSSPPQHNNGGTPNFNSSASNTPNYLSSSSSPVLTSQNSSSNMTSMVNGNAPGAGIFKVDFSQEIKIAKELLDYLTTHHIDPDNSLVGCDVNPIYLDSVFRLRSQNSFSERSLIKMIKSWGAMKDDHIVKEVRKMANNLNNLDFRKGELVIIKYIEQEKELHQPHSPNSENNGINNNNNNNNNNNSNNISDLNLESEDQFFDFDDSLDNIPTTSFNNQQQSHQNQFNINNSNTGSGNEKQDDNRLGSYIFARFEEELNRTCKVYIIPTEDGKQLLSVNINNIYKITPEIIEAAKNEKYIDLVNDPSKPFFHLLAFKERELINDHLEKKNVDVSVMDKCRNNNASILDLPTIKSTMEAVKDLNKNIQNTNLLNEVKKLARLESKSFLENGNINFFYFFIVYYIYNFINI